MSLNVNAGGPTPARPQQPFELPTRFDSSTADRFRELPSELTTGRRLVGWKWTVRDGKRTKPPIGPATGRLASVSDPETWGTIGEAQAAVQRYGLDGIGFVLTQDDPYTIADLDKCRDPETGEIEEWARQIVDELASYTEITPSQTGLRVWIRGTLPPGGRRKGQLELYDCDRYVTLTGDHLTGTPTGIERRQTEIEALHRRVFNEPAAKRTAPQPRPSLTLGDSELIDRARTARNGSKFQRLMAGDTTDYSDDHSAADLGLCNIIAFWTSDTAQIDRIFRQSGLFRPKWDEVHYSTGATYGEWTIRKTLEDRSDCYQGSSQPLQPTPRLSGNGHREPLDGPCETSALALQAENDQLRAEIERLSLEMEKLRHEREELSELLQLTVEVHRNPDLKLEKPAGIALVHELASAQSRGLATEGWIPISRGIIAEKIGCSPESVSNHLKKFSEDIGIIDRDVIRVPAQQVDEHGEIRTVYRSQMRCKLKASPRECLRILADYRNDKPRNWGGRRDACPEHPSADVIVTTTKRCSECDAAIGDPVERRVPAKILKCQDGISESLSPPCGLRTIGGQDGISEPEDVSRFRKGILTFQRSDTENGHNPSLTRLSGHKRHEASPDDDWGEL